MRLADWEGVLDTFLTSNELPRLQAARESDDLEELKRIADGAKGWKEGGGSGPRSANSS